MERPAVDQGAAVAPRFKQISDVVQSDDQLAVDLAGQEFRRVTVWPGGHGFGTNIRFGRVGSRFFMVLASVWLRVDEA